MSLVLRTINTAVGKPLVFEDGTPVANKAVHFSLVSVGGGMLCVIDTTTGQEVLSKNVVATTDANGGLSIALWPTDRADSPCRYQVTVEGLAFRAPLPSGESTLDWNVFVAGRDLEEQVVYVPVAGLTGAAGSQIYSGSVAPTNSIGIDGDYYFDTFTKTIYGPKHMGMFPAGVPLSGSPGSNGVNGNIWYTGSGVPSDATGVNGDYFFAVDTNFIYQKAAGTWSEIGAFLGPAGPGVAPGGNVGQLLRKNGVTDYDTNWFTPSNVAVSGQFSDLFGKPPYVYTGTSTPDNEIGVNPDFFVETNLRLLYGPKVDGEPHGNWGSGFSIAGMPVGGTINQVLTKLDGTNFNVAWQTPSVGGGGAVSGALLVLLRRSFGGF